MRENEDYAREKFNQAVHALATSAGNFRWRLFAAFMAFHTVRDNYFSEAQDRENYRFIIQQLTAPRPMSETSLEGVSDEKCEEIAERIWYVRESLQQKKEDRG